MKDNCADWPDEIMDEDWQRAIQLAYLDAQLSMDLSIIVDTNDHIDTPIYLDAINATYGKV